MSILCILDIYVIKDMKKIRLRLRNLYIRNKSFETLNWNNNIRKMVFFFLSVLFGFTQILKLINLSRCSRGTLLWREVSFKQTADEKPINLPSSWNHGGNTGVKLANTIKGVVAILSNVMLQLWGSKIVSQRATKTSRVSNSNVAFLERGEMHTHLRLVRFCAKFSLIFCSSF